MEHVGLIVPPSIPRSNHARHFEFYFLCAIVAYVAHTIANVYINDRVWIERRTSRGRCGSLVDR